MAYKIECPTHKIELGIADCEKDEIVTHENFTLTGGILTDNNELVCPQTHRKRVVPKFVHLHLAANDI